MPEGYSQADTRRFSKFWDQHGRLWEGWVENKTGHPTGALNPKFDAPWVPPQSAIRLHRDRVQDLVIDYEAILAEREQAHREYWVRAVEEARARQWTVPEPGDPMPEALLLIVGRPPEPVEPVIAAMQGNAYVLGLSTRVDPRLVDFLPSRESRRARVTGQRALPDFSTLPEDEVTLESLMDLEEQVDPKATGGQRVAVGRKRTRPPMSEAA